MPLPSPSPLKVLNFTTLSPQLYTYTPPPPPANSKPTSDTDPELILLCTWLGAEPRHISKYASGFQSLYPSSQILIITTELSDFLLRTNTSNSSRLQPALKVLTSLPPNPKLLISIYSNAGSITMSMLASQYVKEVKKPVPATAILFDSSPGHGNWEHMSALLINLPHNPLLYYPSALLLYTYLSYAFTLLWIQGGETPHEIARRCFNDRKCFEEGMRRCYVYSKGDKVVKWEDVVEHAEEAEKGGWEVEKEVFEGSGHVGHLVAEPERYWGVVRKLWKG